MYNVIKFTDIDGTVNHLAVADDMCSGGISSHPEIIAIEISNLDDAIKLANYFDREINDFWDGLKKPPFFYKEPRVTEDIPDMKLEDFDVPLHVQFEKQKSNPITPSANMENFDY